jgi:hypothetical protein
LEFGVHHHDGASGGVGRRVVIVQTNRAEYGNRRVIATGDELDMVQVRVEFFDGGGIVALADWCDISHRVWPGLWNDGNVVSVVDGVVTGAAVVGGVVAGGSVAGGAVFVLVAGAVMTGALFTTFGVAGAVVGTAAFVFGVAFAAVVDVVSTVGADVDALSLVPLVAGTVVAVLSPGTRSGGSGTDALCDVTASSLGSASGSVRVALNGALAAEYTMTANTAAAPMPRIHSETSMLRERMRAKAGREKIVNVGSLSVKN